MAENSESSDQYLCAKRDRLQALAQRMLSYDSRRAGYDPCTIRAQIDGIERQRQEEVLNRKEEFNLIRMKTAQ